MAEITEAGQAWLEKWTANHFLVESQGLNNIHILNSKAYLSYEEALNLAAWLVALADPERETFPILLDKLLDKLLE